MTKSRKLQNVVAATIVAVMATVFASTASAQHPTANTWTPAGTVITNTATASYTDARGNTYTDVTASVNVTVGFRGSVAVLASSGTASFAAGSTNNTATFTVTNYGNGTDSVNFSFGNTNTSSFTNVRYCVGANCFTTLAGIDTINIASGSSMTVTVKFDVPAGKGGTSGTLSLTGDSRTDGTDATDSDNTAASVTLTGNVAATAAGGGAASVVPTNYNLAQGRDYYTASFTLANNQSGNATYSVSASITGDADIEIVRLARCSALGTAITSVAINYNSSASLCVVYNVRNTADAADAATITLSANDGASASDTEDFTITVIKASLSITKKAYLADGTTLITTQTPKPGDYMWYEISVTNASGAATAQTIQVSDALPSQVTFDASVSANFSADAGTPSWDFTDSTNTNVVGKLTSIAANTTRSFKIKVQIK